VPDVLIARYDEGIQLPTHLELSGESPWMLGPDGAGPVFNSFAVNWLDSNGNLVVHFNPRPDEGVIVVNSCLEGRWGEEVTVPGYPFRLAPDVPFLLRFEVLRRCFRISVDGRPVCDFPHRRPAQSITEVRSTAFLWRLDRAGRAHAPVGESRPGCRGESWVGAEDNPPQPELLPSFRLFAIISTWMEEDVVAATVANCLRQGCERVYLVDNDSPDRTVEEAIGAGAVLAAEYSTERFLEAEKIRQMQAVVDEVSGREDAEHIWWLWVDADEFYQGSGALTLGEHLAGLDRRFRIVGARFFQHLPDGGPAYVPRRHPLDFQRLAYEIPYANCALGHYKHALQRWDRRGSPIACGHGFHDAGCDERLLEPTLPVIVHHFPFRAETATRRRLERLFGQGGGAADRVADQVHHAHLRLRLRSLDALYEQRWEDVAYFPPCARGYVPDLRRWQEWVGPDARDPPRWYEGG
jgi:hypothetical protein